MLTVLFGLHYSVLCLLREIEETRIILLRRKGRGKRGKGVCNCKVEVEVGGFPIPAICNCTTS